MKRYLLFFLILLVLGAGLGVWLLRDPGYVLVSRGFTSIEMSLWLAVLGWLVSLVVAMLLISLLFQVLGMGEWWARWQGLRRQGSSAKALQEGSLALELGDWKRAERLLFNAARLSPQPLPAYLAAARAAARGQAFDRADQYLLLAEEQGNRLAVGLARARLLLEGGRWEQASILLARLQDSHRKDDHILLLRIEALIRLQKWGELSELLPTLQKLPEGEQGRFEALEKHAHREVMRWVALAGGRVDRPYAIKKLRKYWEGLPRRLRNDAELIAVYADELVRVGGDDEAEALLAEALPQQWTNAGIEVYGRARSTRPDQALARAQAWKMAHPHNPALLLALGRLQLQNRHWQEARDYFEASLALHQSPEAHAELIRLLARLDEGEAGRQVVESMATQNTRLPDLPLP